MSNVKERPIILNAQEVNAVLVGDKTQHRMILSSQPYTNECGWQVLEIGGVRISDQCATTRPLDEAIKKRLPTTNAAPYRIGDRLWVQEPTLAIEDVGWIGPVFVASDAGRNAIDWGYGPYDDPAHIPACELTYNKPDDLSYEDSRILLEITDISIERVQDISEADALAMGLKPDYCDHKYQTCEDIGCIGKWAGALFLHLRLDKKLAVHYTDWVWVVEFKVIDGVTDD